MDGTVCFFDRLITNLPTVNLYIWCVDPKYVTLSSVYLYIGVY